MKKWEKIRTVIIPEDISTDTQGISWAEKELGDATFAFDTDENNNSFAITELFVYVEAATQHTNSTFMISNHSEAKYQTQKLININVTIGISGKKSRSWGYLSLLPDGKTYSFGGAFAGGPSNVTSFFNLPSANIEKITAINCFMQNLTNYGFAPGSKFVFYGR